MSAVKGVLPFTTQAEIAAAVPAAVNHVQRGGVLAYPTETVYGLGGGIDEMSVAAVLALKGRENKSLLMLIECAAMLADLGVRVPAYARPLVDAWPGPLTLVLPVSALAFPAPLLGPTGGVAVRVPGHYGIGEVIRCLEAPITSTSANRPGAPPARAAADILEDWTVERSEGTLLVLDGGVLPPSPPSTIVDCTGDRPRLLRSGAITPHDLRRLAPDIVMDR